MENQSWAAKRIPLLLEVPAKVRFLSCEPLLGPLDLSPFLQHGRTQIQWIIGGGESGPHSRPMNPEWVRGLRDQCKKSGIAFHFKQWGHWAPNEILTEQQKKVIVVDGNRLAAVGKKLAGRVLDGRTWDEFPVTQLHAHA